MLAALGGAGIAATGKEKAELAMLFEVMRDPIVNAILMERNSLLEVERTLLHDLQGNYATTDFQFILIKYWIRFIFDILKYRSAIGGCPYRIEYAKTGVPGWDDLEAVPVAYTQGSFYYIKQYDPVNKARTITYYDSDTGEEIKLFCRSSMFNGPSVYDDYVDSEIGHIMSAYRDYKRVLDYNQKVLETETKRELYIVQRSALQDQQLDRTTEKSEEFWTEVYTRAEENDGISESTKKERKHAITLKREGRLTMLPRNSDISAHQPQTAILLDAEAARKVFIDVVFSTLKGEIGVLDPRRAGSGGSLGSQKTKLEVYTDNQKQLGFTKKIATDVEYMLQQVYFTMYNKLNVFVINTTTFYTPEFLLVALEHGIFSVEYVRKLFIQMTGMDRGGPMVHGRDMEAQVAPKDPPGGALSTPAATAGKKKKKTTAVSAPTTTTKAKKASKSLEANDEDRSPKRSKPTPAK
jgi:hypothetical protein